jgi:hypothetical protein
MVLKLNHKIQPKFTWFYISKWRMQAHIQYLHFKTFLKVNKKSPILTQFLVTTYLFQRFETFQDSNLQNDSRLRMFKITSFVFSLTHLWECAWILKIFFWPTSFFLCFQTWVMALVEYGDEFVRDSMWSITFYFSTIFFFPVKMHFYWSNYDVNEKLTIFFCT